MKKGCIITKVMPAVKSAGLWLMGILLLAAAPECRVEASGVRVIYAAPETAVGMEVSATSEDGAAAVVPEAAVGMVVPVTADGAAAVVPDAAAGMAAPMIPEASPQMQLGAVAAGEMQAEGTTLKVYTAVQVLPGSVGIDHINIQYRNLENDRSVTKILRDRDFSNGVYGGWLELNIFEPAGTFVLDKVILRDKNGDYVRYCRAEDRKENDNCLTLPVTAAFVVNNGVALLDETPPVLGAVAVTPDAAPKKSEIRVNAAVADDFSGVDSVTARFENEKGKAISVELKPAGELYTAVIEKSQTSESGTYRLRRVTVTDRMGNSETYRNGKGPLAVEVSFVIR